MSKLTSMNRPDDSIRRSPETPGRAAPAPEGDRPRPRASVFAGMLGLAAALSLLPHVLIARGLFTFESYPLWNVSPVLPLCLYGAAFLRNRAVAALLPIGAWIFAGLVQATWHRDWAAGFPPIIPWVYVGFAAAAAWGLYLRSGRSAARIVGVGLGAGVTFFLTSNFGVWLGGSYGYSPAGLMECYVAALPFFRGTLISLVLFLPALFAPLAVWRPAAASPRPLPAAA